MKKFKTSLGQKAINAKGRWRAHQWLLLRRLMQTTLLTLFLLGPLVGIWIVKGNIASSLTLDVLPLTDPYLALQTLLTYHALETTALVGALIVLLFYLLVGGRTYCAWVCPVNIITDTAAWLHRRLDIKRTAQFARNTRYWVLVTTLLLALFTGTLVWELVNPVTIIYRGLIFGMGLGWLLILAIFLFDLFVSRRGWCGHLCPVGAFYSLLGHHALLRVSASARHRCDDCMDCFMVCPEPQVIRPALKGETLGQSPVILSGNCTNCGRCIDICSENVFRYNHRFDHSLCKPVMQKTEVRP
ncbi:MAG: quinol dehydrogenase ferredoxin subunit NapH [Thiohalomonadaceae bacterium]